MTEIQEAFEKWAAKKSDYDFERWPDEWSSINANRQYKANYTQMDFDIFKAGYLAGEKKGE